MTDVTPPTGTIDITNLVGNIKDTWIRWATTLVVTAASSTPYTFWLKWPAMNVILTWAVRLGVSVLANSIEMQVFFLNTAIRKSSQAQDYIKLVDAKNALPPTATDGEYERAEQAEMLAFRNFVLVSN